MSAPITTATTTAPTTEDKVYSVQWRRYSPWLVCKGTEPRKSYRVVAITTDYREAQLMQVTQCVDRAVLSAMLALAAKATIPAEPVDYRTTT